MKLTVQQIARAVGATLGAHAPPEAVTIQSVCIDSRKVKTGSLFIAIKGENHDGHDHVGMAAAAGAAAVMVSRPVGGLPGGFPQLVVDDTRAAMGRLAAEVRRNFAGRVIAVAGSNGKTGTKHLINAALAGRLRGTASPKSFNNEIGVPLTIFDAPASDDFLVLEIGTNHPGEIANLAEIAQPDIAVITSIGAEHLEFLGDLDGVRRENADIVRGMSSLGVLLINGDDPGLGAYLSGFSGRTVRFGFNPQNDFAATDVVSNQDGVSFCINGGPRLTVPVLGRHSASNALAAVLIGREMGLSDQDIFDGLADATAPEWRLQMQRAGDITILNDAYNANPHSMRAALETLRDMTPQQRRVAILGDMRELGATAEQHHRDIGRLTAGCGIDLLCCVGEQSESIASEAIAQGMDPAKIQRFVNARACASAARAILGRGDLVLLKASRGIGLEAVAKELMK